MARVADYLTMILAGILSAGHSPPYEIVDGCLRAFRGNIVIRPLHACVADKDYQLSDIILDMWWRQRESNLRWSLQPQVFGGVYRMFTEFRSYVQIRIIADRIIF